MLYTLEAFFLEKGQFDINENVKKKLYCMSTKYEELNVLSKFLYIFFINSDICMTHMSA